MLPCFSLSPPLLTSVPTITSVCCTNSSHFLTSVSSCWFCFELKQTDREGNTHASTETPVCWPKKGTNIKKWENPAGLISCQTIYQPWKKCSGLRRSVKVRRQLVYSTWNRIWDRESARLGTDTLLIAVYVFLFCFFLLLWPDSVPQTDWFLDSLFCTWSASNWISHLVGWMVKTK